MSIPEEIKHIRAIGNSFDQVPADDPSALNVLRWQLAKALESICQTLNELDERIDRIALRSNQQVPNFKSDR